MAALAVQPLLYPGDGRDLINFLGLLREQEEANMADINLAAHC